MDRHLSQDCAVLLPSGLAQKPAKPKDHCRARSCNTRLIAPIRCPNCAQDFCPKHRFPADHACNKGRSANAIQPRSAGLSNPAEQNAGLAAIHRVRRTAKAAIKKQTNLLATSATSKRPPIVITIDDSDDDSDIEVVSSRPASKHFIAKSQISLSKDIKTASTTPKDEQQPNAKAEKSKKSFGLLQPETAAEKRARAEKVSQFKALEARDKKGILSANEKLTFASMKAEQARHGLKRDDGCSIL